MPITVQVQGAQYDVSELPARDPDTGQEFTLRIMVVRDPQTGITVHVPLPEKDAEQLGDLLQGKKPPDLVVARPDQMPPAPPGGNHH